MDLIDYKILDILKINGRIAVSDLAKQILLSAPATKERITKMEEAGIIEGYTIKVNHKKLDKSIEAFILFETVNCQAFREFCLSQENILECHRLAGKYSYLVKIVATDMAELEIFIDQALKFGSSSTHIVFSTVIK
ncbi:Lrp/AsnC family transcriptional regulator [Vagococcus sp.]|uniref:Lrp/AsnC family transcriptional regulator n=1 Tax=Vagococcus sp. TaxID=1933889 RepID=UPI002FCB2AEA